MKAIVLSSDGESHIIYLIVSSGRIGEKELSIIKDVARSYGQTIHMLEATSVLTYSLC
jgi:hypothetical protein